MAGTLDIIAVIYAYLLAFIILGIIVLFVKASTWFLARKEGKLSELPPKAPAVKPEAVGEVAKPAPPAAADHAKIAAAVAAVTTHLSLRRAEPTAEVLHPARPTQNLWVLQWRAQANKSPNELCLIKLPYRRPYAA